MRPAGDHVNRFDLVAGNLKADPLIGMDVTLLDQCMSADNDEKLPLAVMPMLTFGDARLADVHAELTVIGSLQQFGE